jgi:hypothetical protein
MFPVSPSAIVVSVYAEESASTGVDQLVEALTPGARHVRINGNDAISLIRASKQLIDTLGARSSEVRKGGAIEQRETFSSVAGRFLSEVEQGQRYLVVSQSTIPLDLGFDATGDWGGRAVFSHVSSYQAPTEELYSRVIRPRAFPLEGYLLVCPMRMDRPVPRHLQDIVTVALALEDRMPVELWLQPRYEHALDAFRRTDLSWLHIDTHGARDHKMMLGPTRDNQRLVDAEALPSRIFTPLVVVCGCELMSGPESIGMTLFRRGVEAVFGPCAIFQSLGVANSEEGEAAWYRVLFESLLSGLDLGTSLLTARRSVSGDGILKYAYLIGGSSHVRFCVPS